MNCIILKFISALEQHVREECRAGMPHKFVVSGNMNLKKAEGGGRGRSRGRDRDEGSSRALSYTGN